jgi:hypothetical protein
MFISIGVIEIGLVDLHEYRKSVYLRKKRSAIKEYNELYEYCLIKGYEHYFHGYLWHVIEIGNVLAYVVEKRGQFVLVSIQFPKKNFTLDKIVEWLNNYSLVLHPRDGVPGMVTEAQAIVKGVLFKGNPILLYRKGTQTLKYNAGKLVEVTDLWQV